MNWLAWFFIGTYAFAALYGVATIGKPRKPTTPGQAVLVVIIDAAFILLIVLFWPRS